MKRLQGSSVERSGSENSDLVHQQVSLSTGRVEPKWIFGLFNTGYSRFLNAKVKVCNGCNLNSTQLDRTVQQDSGQ
jgi:hypothetical protein